MSITTPVATKNLDGYGNPEIPWSRAFDQITAKKLSQVPGYLGSVRSDGRPHVARVGAIWIEDALFFTSHPTSQKARNIAFNPICTYAASIDGMDLTLEGIVSRVTDPAQLARISAAYIEHGWPAVVDGDQMTAPYNAPSAGPAPWNAYRFEIRSAVGGATAEPYGATRWDFAD